MKVRFRAAPFPAQRGFVTLQVLDHEADVAQFLAKHRDDGKERDIEVALEVHYQKRTLNQNSLQWELCRRLGAKQGVDPELIHEGAKAVMYPAEELPNGIFVPKRGADLTTVEYSQVVEYLIMECAENQVDISDIWILFTDWRFGQETDPLEGTYVDSDDYRTKHPLCEACGSWIAGGDGELDHIYRRGRDNRGPDEDWNWLHLCHGDHGRKHTAGILGFLGDFPHLETKCRRAYQRAGSGWPPAEANPGTRAEDQGSAPEHDVPESGGHPAAQVGGVGDSSAGRGPEVEEKVWETAARVFDGEVVQ